MDLSRRNSCRAGQNIQAFRDETGRGKARSDVGRAPAQFLYWIAGAFIEATNSASSRTSRQRSSARSGSSAYGGSSSNFRSTRRSCSARPTASAFGLRVKRGPAWVAASEIAARTGTKSAASRIGSVTVCLTPRASANVSCTRLRSVVFVSTSACATNSAILSPVLCSLPRDDALHFPCHARAPAPQVQRAMQHGHAVKHYSVRVLLRDAAETGWPIGRACRRLAGGLP